MRGPALALLLAARLAAPLAAQEPAPAGAAQLYTAVQPDTVAVGEPFRSVVRLTVAPGARAGYPPLPVLDELQPVDSVRLLPADATGATATAVYTLVAWTTDTLRAAVPVRVALPSGEARVYRVPLRLPVVRSVLPADGEDVAPRPARGVVGAPAMGLPWWLLALAALAAAAAAALLLLRRRAPAVEASGTPRERALARLARLDGADAPDVHVEASAALRDYLAELSSAWGVERTTTELLDRLLADGLEGGAREALGGLLRAADRVKFAGHHPDPRATADFLAAAREWVLAVPPAAPRREAA